MDVKELRGESALAERGSDGGTKFAPTAPTLQYDRPKSCQELGSNSFKVDGQGARPCAVIGPDRIAQPARDTFLKKAPVEPWLSPDSLYRRPPDYPHKMSEYQDPNRNISPRQTFQENMQRIIMPPGYNTLKVNEDPTYASKNTKLNVPLEAKYCDVPYNNPMSSDLKNVRNSDHSVSNVNPLLMRGIPHGWPGSVSVRPLRPYGAPDMYQYPDYASCTGSRPPLSRPLSHDEPSPIYPEPYYHEGNIRYKPYPNIKERYPQPRYEYLGNYSNPYHTPHAFATHKYELPKTMPNHPYPGYPQAPLKYTDRVPEPVMDGYQRSFNQQGSYGIPYRNPVIHPPYRSGPGNPLQGKLHPYPDGPNKSIVPNKQPYDPNSKMYVDYETCRPKAYPVNDNLYVNEMARPYHTKNSILLPNYAPANIHGLNPHPYIQLKNYEYARYKMDPSIINNPLAKLPMQFSPTTLAISPADSNASNDTVQTHGTSHEDCGYVSQSSITSGRSIDNRLPMDIYGRNDFSRFSPIVRGSSFGRSDPNNQVSKSKKDIRQFIASWNEGDDENVENSSKREIPKTGSSETHNFPQQYEHGGNQEQLYVLGLVNVPSEELGKYEHIQKVSKLPENIKGYNSLELLNQFEEAIESSNINSVTPPIQRGLQIPLKNVSHKQDPLPRAVSPLDVEAKISQSVIHKDVGCNFEIKPCSPKMLNVQMAAPVQTILNERAIEKVANPQSRKSPIVVQHLNENIESILNKKSIKYPVVNTAPSCKMVNSQVLSEVSAADHLKTNYCLQDLESNLGVCLASLPRLDNDIELNFPEVNQQFINANKTESVITNSFSKDLPAVDIDRSETISLKTNTESEFDLTYPFSPGKGKIDTDKEFSRLSKYRKLKKNITEDSDITQTKTQATRVDSVIIKNPDNPRMHEDNSDAFRSDGHFRKDSQEYAINLATQEKNSLAQSEMDKKYIVSNRCENTDNHSPNDFVTHSNTHNVFNKTCDDVEASNNNDERDFKTEVLSMSYKDISNRYLDKTALDIPINLSPQNKYLDEEVINNKNSDKMIHKEIIVITKSDHISSGGSIHKSTEQVKMYQPIEDTTPENLNTSPHASNQVFPDAKEHSVTSLNSNTQIVTKTEDAASNLNCDTPLVPKAEEHAASSLTPEAPAFLQDSSLNADTQVLHKLEEHIVSSLNSDTWVSPKTEGRNVSMLSDTQMYPRVEQSVSKLTETQLLFKAEHHAVSSFDLKEGCNYADSNYVSDPENNESNLSLNKSDDTNIEKILQPLASDLLIAEEAKLEKNETCTSNKSKCFEVKGILQDVSADEPSKEQNICQNPNPLHNEIYTLPQNDLTQVKCMKENNVYVPKLRRNKEKSDICCPEKNTDDKSTKDKLKMNHKKHKYTSHSKNKNAINKPPYNQLMISDVKTDNDGFQQDISATDASENNYTGSTLLREIATFENGAIFPDDKQCERISVVLNSNNTGPQTPMLRDTLLSNENIEKIPEFNTNMDINLPVPIKSNNQKIHESSGWMIPNDKNNSIKTEYDTDDNPLGKREPPVPLDKNEQPNNKANKCYDVPKQALLTKRKFNETDLLNEDVCYNMCSELCEETDNDKKEITKANNKYLTIPRPVRKELFSSRFQNLLSCNEDVGILDKIDLSKTFEVEFILQKLDYDFSAPKRETVQGTDLIQKKYEQQRSTHRENTVYLNNDVNDYTEKHKMKECFLTESNQGVDDINHTNKSFSSIDMSSINTIDHTNEEKIFDIDGYTLKEKSTIELAPLSTETKNNNNCQLENLLEGPTKKKYHEKNCSSVSTQENVDEIDGEVTETLLDQEINLELGITDITHVHYENINEAQKLGAIYSPLKTQNVLHKKFTSHKFSAKPRYFLKRSLSDSALDELDGDTNETQDRKRFLLPKKSRTCFNSNNIEGSQFLNIIQNSRRNSISTLCNENISFCILIDDNCIIEEENYDQEDSHLGKQTVEESSYLNNVQEQNCNDTMLNLDVEGAHLAVCEDEKSWVENVDYEETIETEDIAENIVIGEPISPNEPTDYESDDGDMGILSAEMDHTNKVKHIYGDNMCINDAQLVDALYRTPQMDVNKKLMDRESQIVEKPKYYDTVSLEMLLAEPINSHQYGAIEPEPLDNICPSSEVLREGTPNYVLDNVGCKEESSLLVTHFSGTENTECNKSATLPIINEKPNDDTAHSSESKLDNVVSCEIKPGDTSSSPEVSSTTSEEKNSSILLKISNYKGSRISEANNLSKIHNSNRKESSCNVTEKEYVHPNYNKNSHGTLITKAAQKYIPPLKETIPDLKVKLILPQQSLLKLKENKVSKEEPKVNTRNICINNNIHIRKEFPKKVKPKFEDVLKNIDEVQFKKHKNNKKSRKTIPKVVIKKTGNGSHYASSSEKTSFDPDLTGRKWQPWVFIEKNRFVDKMALTHKTKAVFSHRKKSYVLDEKFYKYKSISSGKFFISQPKLNEFSTGNLKYTIKLKHCY